MKCLKECFHPLPRLPVVGKGLPTIKKKKSKKASLMFVCLFKYDIHKILCPYISYFLEEM